MQKCGNMKEHWINDFMAMEKLRAKQEPDL